MQASINLVSAIVLDDHQRILLQLRDDKPDISHPGHWSLFGGKPEAQETHTEALQRELFEELSVRIDQAELTPVVELDESPDKHHRAAHIVLNEGQSIGRFQSLDLADKLSSGEIDHRPIIPAMRTALKHYLRLKQ